MNKNQEKKVSGQWSVVSGARRRSGQLIIEALVSITLFIMSFMGILALLNRSLGLTRVVADTHVATYLAAEGIEVVKNLIDSVAIRRDIDPSISWYQGFDSCTTPCAWEVQYDTNWEDSTSWSDLAFSPARRLFYDAAGLYQYDSSGTPTNFFRTVEITLGNNELIVKSNVSWVGRGGATSRVDLEDHFFNWH